MQEFMLVPIKKTNPATPSQRSLMRRSKNSERAKAKRMVEIDGVDPAYEKITTSTGRVGHITNLRIDAISRSYVTENKNRALPSWLTNAWLLINQRAIDFDKNAVLHLDPPNMVKEFPINGTMKPLDSMDVLTQTRHEELILIEKDLTQIKTILESPDNDLSKLRQIRELFGL